MRRVGSRADVWMDRGAMLVVTVLGAAAVGVVLWPHLVRWWVALALPAVIAATLAAVVLLVRDRGAE